MTSVQQSPPAPAHQSGPDPAVSSPRLDSASDARSRAPQPLQCRFCHSPVRETFVDLGVSPLANAFLRPEDLNRMEPFHPLCVRVCSRCFLVQLPVAESPEAIFGDYAYFSSYAPSWLRHAEAFAHEMIDRLSLDGRSMVVEVASNDGYLLQYLRERDVPVLGIEPARNVAAVARERGIPTLVEFFGSDLAARLRSEGCAADLLVGNNVLAHVPDLNDFVAGLAILLAPRGVLTLEFPHLLKLIQGTQFDTIYHEHFSYFSFTTARRVLAAHRLTVFDVEEIPTHGGSLRIYARHDDADSPPVTERVGEMLARESAEGLSRIETYRSFGERIGEVRLALLDFLIRARREGRSVAGYGAPAKASTLLNFCGVRTDLVPYTVDRSPHKQGLFLPGTRIPIVAPERLRETRPDFVLILPWNLAPEIVEQHAYVRAWGGRFVVPIPTTSIIA